MMSIQQNGHDHCLPSAKVIALLGQTSRIGLFTSITPPPWAGLQSAVHTHIVLSVRMLRSRVYMHTRACV